ncbi:MAG: hypothetical protein UU49_C0006G0020 [Candidatus Magasanikbacteria bacterium GW2011_GWC2_41_17]|uniref:Integral membrane protein n=1 Tax=Candidatus Magasanikbacteria bacterium GW2011_GWC2_41_17 TaxID=1619048 RepID=A0A0G0VEY9_9BACT|nr:MAG: hypothetical protein UU49_C0006G0020 [Candidatus Magasanikbacteria bacterium GW2011_GWC2_41_17]
MQALEPLIHQSPTTKKLIAVIISAFLSIFFLSRLYVYLVLGHLAPNLFVTIRGVHIHHFAYGFFILAGVGLYLLIKHPAPDSKTFYWVAWFYGLGLGLATDEFAMWFRLEDNYWVRQSYDAVIIVTLGLLNIAYFKQLLNWLKEMLLTFKNWTKKGL